MLKQRKLLHLHEQLTTTTDQTAQTLNGHDIHGKIHDIHILPADPGSRFVAHGQASQEPNSTLKFQPQAPRLLAAGRWVPRAAAAAAHSAGEAWQQLEKGPSPHTHRRARGAAAAGSNAE